jgi:hypothetical protein
MIVVVRRPVILLGAHQAEPRRGGLVYDRIAACRPPSVAPSPSQHWPRSPSPRGLEPRTSYQVRSAIGAMCVMPGDEA